tara:strand:+ start:1102 stop:1509 length:408 start_codon:yes stop_codon:yes gene_type:complete
MAAFMLYNASVVINSVDLSDHVTSITFSENAAELETTAMGDSNVTRIGGLLDGNIDLEFNQDMQTSETQATIRSLVGTVTTVVVKSDAAAVSAANPSWTFSALVTEWPSVNGTVGELATASISWPLTGAVVQAVS